jgi:chemotaxis protein methyltransferase CheR
MADKTLNFELNIKEENGIPPGSKALSVTGNEMSKDEFDKMRDLIYNLSGIYFTENKKYLLESRVSKRIKANNMVSFSQYIYFLQTMYGRKELDALFEAITINETFFYRVPQQFEALENTIIPQLIKMKSHLPNPTIRIWSAATSTGEEAYTLAIIVLEKLKPLYPDVDFKIIGTDINNAVLELARRGIYKEYAVRNMPVSWFSKYFVKDSNKYYLKNEV